MQETNVPIPNQDAEVFRPAPEIVAHANVQNLEQVRREAAENLEGYWERRAGELEWYRKWDKVLDESAKPFFKWFVGGKTNIVLNALDRHVKTEPTPITR